MDVDLAEPQDEQLARALVSVGNPTRLALLRQLRAPKTLREIEVRPRGSDEEYRKISRQAVREHLDRLVEIGVVLPRETEREYGPTVEYVLNHQTLYAIAEEFRGLARIRPTAEPESATVQSGAPPAPYRLEGPCLVLVHGLDVGRTFPLPAPAAGRREWVVGRRRGLDVPLDFDPFVSTENSLVVWEDGIYRVEDIPESRNGTQLNFQPLPRGGRRPLQTGDLVGVGRSLLMFRG